MSFEVLKTVSIDGHDFERVKHRELGWEAIRKRYDNSAGQTSRTCPTVWVDDLRPMMKAILELTNPGEV